jgi:predicted RNA-binding Zn-ribbon protein involved in translation (DUF1610 family)
MEKFIRKIPIHGFISVCLKCKSNKVRIEVREDGVDFQCLVCGNKMLLRPGESFQLQVPQAKVKNKVEQFEKELNKPLTQDWADEVLDEWLKKQEEK